MAVDNNTGKTRNRVKLREQIGTVSSNGHAYQAYGDVWLDSQDPINNTSTFTVASRLRSLNGGNTRFEGTVYDAFIRMDGAYRYTGNYYSAQCNPWPAGLDVAFQVEQYTVAHDVNGNKTVDIWQHHRHGTGYGPGSCYVSSQNYAYQVAMPQIDRAGPVITMGEPEVTSTTIKLKPGYNVAVDWEQWAYWEEGTAVGAYTDAPNGLLIEGLKSNTTYIVRLKTRRTHNQVWTDTGEMRITTAPATVQITYFEVTNIEPKFCTIKLTTDFPENVDRIVLVINGVIHVSESGGVDLGYPLEPDTDYHISATVYTKITQESVVEARTFRTPSDSPYRFIRSDGYVSKGLEVYAIQPTGVVTKIDVEGMKVIT